MKNKRCDRIEIRVVADVYIENDKVSRFLIARQVNKSQLTRANSRFSIFNSGIIAAVTRRARNKSAKKRGKL